MVTVLMGVNVLLSNVYDTVTFAPATDGDAVTDTVTFCPTVNVAGEVVRVRVTLDLVTRSDWGVENVSE
jgi:hypothetical protein